MGSHIPEGLHLENACWLSSNWFLLWRHGGHMQYHHTGTFSALSLLGASKWITSNVASSSE